MRNVLNRFWRSTSGKAEVACQRSGEAPEFQRNGKNCR